MWHAWQTGGEMYDWGGSEEERPLGKYGRGWCVVLLNCMIKICDGRVWVALLARDRGRWRVALNAIMNLFVPYEYGEFLSYLRN